MYTSDNKRSIALILKDLEHLFYSLYHNHIKQLLHIVTYRGLNSFIVIFPFITGSRKKKKRKDVKDWLFSSSYWRYWQQSQQFLLLCIWCQSSKVCNDVNAFTLVLHSIVYLNPFFSTNIICHLAYFCDSLCNAAQLRHAIKGAGPNLTKNVDCDIT